MSETTSLNVMLVDPSLFTAPYDAALTQGLVANGVAPMWMTRPTRRADRQELPLQLTDPFFYRRTDEASWVPDKLKPIAKGIAHFAGLVKLLMKVRRQKPDVVHFQWIVVPPLDVLAMALLRRWRPLVLTVHDTVPFNGQKMSWLQRFGHDTPMKCAHQLIVHTRSGRQALLDRGVPAQKIAVIPHGPLQLSVPAPSAPATRDPRWTVLLFGEIKPYKGLDLLIEAVASLPVEARRELRVIVAGRPRMDLAPLVNRIDALGLQDQFDMRPRRLSEEEMAAVFAEADCFVFPYRQIDASGVYFLVKGLGKWLIASRVGIFAEDVHDGVEGVLIASEDIAELARELHNGITRRPQRTPVPVADSWTAIGRSTRQLYLQAIAEHRGEQRVGDQRSADA
jgi:glycosyltransferase involved in cell wall biosynthesis